jgi:hypothetical protein
MVDKAVSCRSETLRLAHAVQDRGALWEVRIGWSITDDCRIKRKAKRRLYEGEVYRSKFRDKTFDEGLAGRENDWGTRREERAKQRVLIDETSNSRHQMDH